MGLRFARRARTQWGVPFYIYNTMRSFCGRGTVSKDERDRRITRSELTLTQPPLLSASDSDSDSDSGTHETFPIPDHSAARNDTHADAHNRSDPARRESRRAHAGGGGGEGGGSRLGTRGGARRARARFVLMRDACRIEFVGLVRKETFRAPLRCVALRVCVWMRTRRCVCAACACACQCAWERVWWWRARCRSGGDCCWMDDSDMFFFSLGRED
jgi:hypothetical protein